MRSAFMSSSGDPYVLLYSLSFYESVWQDEVDELWVGLNSTMEREVMAELVKKIPKSVKFFYMNKRLGYGKPLNLLLELSPDGKVLLLEDDSIIFKKGVVTKYFDLLDEYDAIGSPRMSCTKEIADKLKKEFNLDYQGWGDKGPNFWPCFFWTHKDLLRKTDRNFDPTDWGDTFCWMSVQLRRLTNKILEIPQYHCSPDDFQNEEQGLGIFDGECGYMHLGSLSSGIESYLFDSDSVPLTDREAGIKGNLRAMEKTKEMERRLSWWVHCHTANPDFHRSCSPFDRIYADSLDKAMELSGKTHEMLNKWINLYMGVIND